MKFQCKSIGLLLVGSFFNTYGMFSSVANQIRNTLRNQTAQQYTLKTSSSTRFDTCQKRNFLYNSTDSSLPKNTKSTHVSLLKNCTPLTIDPACKKAFLKREEQVKVAIEDFDSSDSELYKKLQSFETLQALRDDIFQNEANYFNQIVAEIEKKTNKTYAEIEKEIITAMQKLPALDLFNNDDPLKTPSKIIRKFIRSENIIHKNVVPYVNFYTNELQKKANINKKVHVFPTYTNPKKDIGAANGFYNCIFLNTAAFRNFPNVAYPEIGFIFLHELAHIINQDTIRKFTIKTAVYKYKCPVNRLLYKTWQHTIELKADLYFLLSDQIKLNDNEKLKILKQSKRFFTDIYLNDQDIVTKCLLKIFPFLEKKIDWDELAPRFSEHPAYQMRLAYVHRAEQLLKKEMKKKSVAAMNAFQHRKITKLEDL